MRVGRTYVYERSTSSNKMTTFVILAAITAALGVWTVYSTINNFNNYRDLKKSFGSLIVEPSSPGLGYGSVFSPANIGRVVHVNIPQSDLTLDHALFDPVFSVYVAGAVSLNRRVEYCQWQEHYTERTEKTGEDTERVVRTYYYTKGWTSSPINSLFFDQPAAHHNPQRRPVDSGAVDVTGVSSGHGFKLPATYMNYFKSATKTFFFTPESLQGFLNSPARVNDNFFYTGNNGWFLSKYEPSTAERAMKAAFEYIEGTLFDFQLGDLFSTCEAGDVRVSLEGKVLQNGFSAIALQNADGTLSPFKTLSGNNVMLAREGQFTADEMMKLELNDVWWSFVWFAIGALVSCALCVLFCKLISNERSKTKDDNSNEKKTE